MTTERYLATFWNMKPENMSKTELLAKYKRLLSDVKEEKRLKRQIDREFEKLYKENFPTYEPSFKDRVYYHLQDRKGLRKLKFDTVVKDATGYDGFVYDIVAHDSNNAVVLTVTQSPNQSCINKVVHKVLPRFKSQHSKILAEINLYGGLASENLTPEGVEKIERAGLFALTKSHNGITVLNKRGFEPRAY